LQLRDAISSVIGGSPDEDSAQLSSLIFCFPPEFAAGTGVFAVNKATLPT
jgi:hypothetical protein